MDRAANFLSECLIIPNAALQDHIDWEEIDAPAADYNLLWENAEWHFYFQ